MRTRLIIPQGRLRSYLTNDSAYRRENETWASGTRRIYYIKRDAMHLSFLYICDMRKTNKDM